MSAFTKDELRMVLTNHGVELPNSSARKEELVALYEQFVGPMERSHGEFSSDDEVEIQPIKKTSRKSVTSKASVTTTGDKSQILAEETETTLDRGFIDLSQMSDGQLAEELRRHGVDVGPIVETTRSLYEKKLARVLQPAEQHSANGDESIMSAADADASHLENGSQLKNGEFSADEEEAGAATTEEDEDQPSGVVRKIATPVRKSARTPKPKGSPSTSLSSIGTSIRQRFGGKPDETDGPGRFTPTPRRSIHTYKVTETTTETTVKTPDGKVARDFAYKKETTESKGDDGAPTNTILRLLPKCFMVLILIAVAYYVATTYYPNALEDLKAKVQESTNSKSDATSSSGINEPAPDQKTISDI